MAYHDKALTGKSFDRGSLQIYGFKSVKLETRFFLAYGIVGATPLIVLGGSTAILDIPNKLWKSLLCLLVMASFVCG